MRHLKYFFFLLVLLPFCSIKGQMLDYIAREAKFQDKNEIHHIKDTTFFHYSENQAQTIHPMFSDLGLLKGMLYSSNLPEINYDGTNTVYYTQTHEEKWSTVRFKNNGKIDSSYFLDDDGFISLKYLYSYDSQGLLENETQFSYNTSIIGWKSKYESIMEYENGLLKKRVRTSESSQYPSITTNTDIYTHNIYGQDSIFTVYSKRTGVEEKKYLEYRSFYNSDGQLDSVHTERNSLTGSSQSILGYKHNYDNDTKRLSSSYIYVLKDNAYMLSRRVFYIYDNSGQLRTTKISYQSSSNFTYGDFYEYNEEGNISRVSNCYGEIENCPEFDVKFYIYTENAVVSTIETDRQKSSLIYPNPVSDNVLHISSDDEVNSAEIISVSGKIIISSKVKDQTLDISQLNPGFYIVKINYNNSYETHGLIRR